MIKQKCIHTHFQIALLLNSIIRITNQLLLNLLMCLEAKVHQSTINAIKGMNKVQWSPSMGTGVYIANLVTNRGQFKMKIVKGE